MKRSVSANAGDGMGTSAQVPPALGSRAAIGGRATRLPGVAAGPEPAPRRVDGLERGSVPVEVESAASLAGRILGGEAAEPAVVRAVAGGGVHALIGVGRLGRRTVGTDDVAVLEVAERDSVAVARLA